MSRVFPTLSSRAADVLQWLHARVAADADLRLDSRDVAGGDVFVACPGRAADGRAYVAQAVAAGAAVVLFDATDGRPAPDAGVPALGVEGLRGLLGELGDAWYGRPSEALAVIAVTGTNGKTSCVQWVAEALNAHGVRCGTIGTLGAVLPGGASLGAGLTTPDALTMHRVLARMRDAGAEAVALEASSIGIEQGRLDGVRIAVAGFTNLTRDHLDYHGTMEQYEQAKRRLFAWPGLHASIVNADDEAGRRILADAETPGAVGYSLAAQGNAPIRAADIRNGTHGLLFILVTPEGAAQVVTRLVGEHNVANLLLVAGVLRALRWPLARIASALSESAPVDGRLQAVEAPAAQAGAIAPLVVVDYSHTPDSLARALAALRPLAEARGGRLACVFGCGGDRDPGKRPEMGRIAAQQADLVVVTSDNPRSESPMQIIGQIVQGVPVEAAGRVRVMPERSQAILRAVWSMSARDVVLLAGKGHETYQEIAGRRLPFDDREWARAALAMLPAPAVSTDTRAIGQGQLFVALSGERFDGHDYLAQARSAGACAAIVERRVEGCDIEQIVLGDTRQALGRLAGAWRARFALPLVGVTGSNGKTTTKEMIAAILAAGFGESARLATEGNLNNDIGVPLTLLRLREHHRCAVVELGMNHPGEIAWLAEMAAPTVALVTNAQREHQEFMHSVEAVARENGSVLQALAAGGTAVYPADETHSPIWDELSEGHARLRFGLSAQAEVHAHGIEESVASTRCRVRTPMGEGSLRLAVPGRHNLRNALAAIACSLAAGVDLETALAALAGFSAVKGRMQSRTLPDGTVLVDDTYNANPDSVRAAIDVLAQMPAPRVLVLGDMGEVGNEGPAMHREVGAYARERGIDAFYAMGEACEAACEAYGAGARHFAGPGDVADALAALRPGSVLVKGSRFMRMERVVSSYTEKIDKQSGTTGDRHAS